MTTSIRTISAKGCAGQNQIALSPAFRAFDTHDVRRRLPATKPNCTLACISRPRHARSPQKVARAHAPSRSRLHFAHSTRTISAKGCPDKTKSHSRLHFAHSTRTISAEVIRHARSPQRVAFRGGAAALPPALREKVKKSER